MTGLSPCDGATPFVLTGIENASHKETCGSWSRHKKRPPWGAASEQPGVKVAIARRRVDFFASECLQILKGPIVRIFSIAREPKIKKIKNSRERGIYIIRPRGAPPLPMRAPEPAPAPASPPQAQNSIGLENHSSVNGTAEHRGEHGICTGKSRGTWNVPGAHSQKVALVNRESGVHSMYASHARVHTNCTQCNISYIIGHLAELSCIVS